LGGRSRKQEESNYNRQDQDCRGTIKMPTGWGAELGKRNLSILWGAGGQRDRTISISVRVKGP